MRTAVIAIAVAGLLTGCTVGADADLKALVEEAALPGVESDCEWGSSSFDGEPAAWVGCWQYARSSLRAASRGVGGRLASHGFAVRLGLAPDGHAVQLTATRGADVVCVDVLEPGFSHGRNTHPGEIDPAPGEVFVDVWAVEPTATGGPRCAELPAWLDE